MDPPIYIGGIQIVVIESSGAGTRDDAVRREVEIR